MIVKGYFRKSEQTWRFTRESRYYNNSKAKSDENNKKIIEAVEKTIDINQKREKYLPVATRGAVLYFSVVDMQEISKMYSTSLQQFSELFETAIDTAIPSN